jgi:Rod binding domain-containing protein
MSPVTALAPAASTALNALGNVQAKARAAAQDFEAMFLNAMMQPMFSSVKSEGPFGDGPGGQVWKSMLTDQYARTFAANGGVGIADHVYQALLQAQEGRSAGTRKPG